MALDPRGDEGADGNHRQAARPGVIQGGRGQEAAYAAPLILLAQTRQVDRDKVALDQLEAHREEVMKRMQEREAALKRETDELKALLKSNTQLTQQDKDLTEKVEALTREIHARVIAAST